MFSFVRDALTEIIFKNRRPQPIPVLDSALYPNSRLDECPIIMESLNQPDDFVIDDRGALYISSENRVLRFSPNETENGWVEEPSIYAEFQGNAGGLNFHNDGRLMVCVDGEGVWFVTNSGPVELINRIHHQSLIAPTCAMTGPDGCVYITNGSKFNGLNDWVRDLMEKRHHGSLFRFDPTTGKGELLLTDLYYPHGICFQHDEEHPDQTSLILTESWAHRVTRFPISDIRCGTGMEICRNLPGYPARIITDKNGHLWISLFSMRTHLVELVLQENRYRKEMISRIEPEYWIAPALNSGNSYFEPLQGGQIKKFGEIKPWAPPRSYGLVVKMDGTGEIVESLHSRCDGKRHGITGLREHDGKLKILSKGHGLLIETIIDEKGGKE